MYTQRHPDAAVCHRAMALRRDPRQLGGTTTGRAGRVLDKHPDWHPDAGGGNPGQGGGNMTTPDIGNRRVDARRIAFPYRIDQRGRTAQCPESDHIRDLIEQVLLTTPGERVMRPEFGAALLQRVFEPAGPELVATTQYLVQTALVRELAERIRVDNMELTATDNTLVITVAWTQLSTGATNTTAVTVPTDSI